MAATIAKARGVSKGKVSTWATRLGSSEAEAQANTWKTFSECYVRANGSGYVEATRDGVTFLRLEWGPETGETETSGFVEGRRIEPTLTLGSTRKRSR